MFYSPKYKCKGQICVFGKYSTDVLSVKVEKRVVGRVLEVLVVNEKNRYLYGVAVGDGVKKYSLGAGGVVTSNPSSPSNVKYVTWPG